MFDKIKDSLKSRLQDIREAGLYKQEHLINSTQNTRILLNDGREVINLCANNYLGLSDHPDVMAAAQEGLKRWGYGTASVRFICGTQNVHRELEDTISAFFGTEDTILYSSCFDANGGLFETILTAEDAIISDSLNHASIIDGIRLCKARRLRYKNADLEDLEAKLDEAQNCRFRMIATDGVFSMDGIIAPLDKICDLADRYGALLMIDDCHAAGFLGATGGGTPEYCNCEGRVDVITGTLGKALGGASGGYTTGRKEIIDLLRQHSRPYLFSNSLAPVIAAASINVFEMLATTTELRDRLEDNTGYWREGLKKAGFVINPGEHPIVPIILGDAKLSQQFATELLARGIYAVGFFYPVVPRNTARIRTQISAAHTRDDLNKALEVFSTVRDKLL